MLRLVISIGSFLTSVADVTNWIQPNTGKLEPMHAGCNGLEAHTSNSTFSSERKGDSGGHWTPCTHLKTYGMNLSPGTARFLANFLKPKTSLEFGCGLGLLSDYIRRFANTDVTCIEPDKALGQLLMKTASQTKGGSMTAISANVLDEEDEAARFCASSLMERKFDVVFSFEVAEHVPFKNHKNLVDLLVKSTGKWLVFSAARLGQIGTGHLNESSFSREHWIKTFEKAGLQHMPKLSAVAAEAGYWARSYDLYGNTFVMKNPSYAAEDSNDVSAFDGFEWGGTYNDERTKSFVEGQLGDEHLLKTFQEIQKGEEVRLWPDLAAQIRDIATGKRNCDNEEDTDL